MYATSGHVSDYMIQNGVEYAFVTDHLGSVRYVVDTTDGSIAQRLEYDEFGQVVSDSNPGFQPFGFAGGLYDQDTGLTRFGVRDYDPSVGRWTAPDPIGFAGRQTNLFMHAGNSPQTKIDPSGLAAQLALVVVPGLIAGTFNAYEARGQSYGDVARAFATGAVGGAVAGVGALLNPLGAVAGTALGAGITKGLDLAFCVDAVDQSFTTDVADASVSAGLAAAGALIIAHTAGIGIVAAVTTSRSGATTAQTIGRSPWQRTMRALRNVEPEVWDAAISETSSGLLGPPINSRIQMLGGW